MILLFFLAQHDELDSMLSAIRNLSLEFDPTVVPFEKRERAREFSMIELRDDQVRLRYDLTKVVTGHLADLCSAVISMLSSEKFGPNGLTLYKKFTRRDAMLLLGFETMMNEQSIGGYRYDKTTPRDGYFHENS